MGAERAGCAAAGAVEAWQACCCHAIGKGPAFDTSRAGRSSTVDDCGGDAQGGDCIGVEELARWAAACLKAAALA